LLPTQHCFRENWLNHHQLGSEKVHRYVTINPSLSLPNLVWIRAIYCRLLFFRNIYYSHTSLSHYLLTKVALAGEQTWDLLISFIFSFHHHFTAEPQRLPLTLLCYEITYALCRRRCSRVTSHPPQEQEIIGSNPGYKVFKAI
jgi:hypothetical protein